MDESKAFLSHMQERCTDSALASNNALALLFLKLKGLDLLACVFNDEAIEHLIESVRDTISLCLHCENRIFRTKSDVFALVLPGFFCKELLPIVIHKVMTVINHHHVIEGKPVRLRAHVGITVLEKCVASGSDPIKEASTALYNACESNLPFVIYEEKQSENPDYHLSLSSELTGALDNNEFFLEYQPQLNLYSGLIESAEALIRWNNKKHGILGPDRFIRIAEKQGLITRLSEWVIDNAVRYQREMDLAGMDLLLSVNLSASDLLNAALPDYIGQSLSIWNVSPNRLALEITEGSMIRSIETVLPLLHALKNMGIALSVDDFGTGYSSLKYIKDLPVSELKLDQTFVKKLPDSKNDRKIVRTVASLANNFNFQIVAEGVESKEAMLFLAESGYDKIQGYHLSPPLSEQEFVKFIRRFNTTRKK
ncbi:MAG: GGDEF domain-containing phosphodiesterase [Methylococcaceae bacterium]|nr:GGDEF domain-containing phosphodiesterase [Methylococcaceae bacterium]